MTRKLSFRTIAGQVAAYIAVGLIAIIVIGIVLAMILGILALCKWLVGVIF